MQLLPMQTDFSAAAPLAKTHEPKHPTSTPRSPGNICRCGAYVRVRAAMEQAAHIQPDGDRP